MGTWVEIASGEHNGVRWRVERARPFERAPVLRVVCPCGGAVVVGSSNESHADVVAAALTEAAKVAR